MAFFNIGKKVGEIAESASKKSSAFIETTRLNTEINKILSDIDNFQYELGKAYYEENKTKSVGPYAEMIAKISNLEYEVRTRNDKILAYKGLTYCTKCDAVVSYEDEFCNKCGASVPEKKPDRQETCRNCGEALGEEDSYCSKCGVLAKAAPRATS